MTARDISRCALTTLLALVPRDNEIQVWPIERTTNGPATLHKTLEHIGRDTITAILIDAGILTVKNNQLALKKLDNLILPSVIMTFLADDSPIEVDARFTTIKKTRTIFWTIKDRKIVASGRRRSSFASPDSSLSTFDSLDDSYIKDVLAKYKNLRAAPEHSLSPPSQGLDKDSKPKREVAKTVQKVGKDSSALISSNNYQPISKKKFNGMERVRIEKNGEISTLKSELMECRQTIENLNEPVRAYDSLRKAELMECRQTIENLNEQVRAYDSLRREKVK